jgi:hypothetical protein
VPISVVIITYNEERNLPRTLEQLRWCDDVIVVDSYSQDRTLEIAHAFQCRVVQQRFEGYGLQKNHGIALAKHDWVLSIDADEVLSQELQHELQQLDLAHSDYQGYFVSIRHVFMNKAFRYGKGSAYPKLRLFHKKTGQYNLDQVHEKVVLNGPTTHLKGRILHHSYHDLSHFVRKMNDYSERAAIQMFQQGKTNSLLGILMKMPFYFFKYYFLNLNILNGKAGFIWSWQSTWYHTLKYLKLYEMNRQSSKGSNKGDSLIQ